MKPHSLRGITSTYAQSEISTERFPEVQFIREDAIDFVSGLPCKSIDRVFALDCIYHFSSRTKFLQESSRVLRSDGAIVLTDLIFNDNVSPSQRLIMYIICLLTGSPYVNFKTLRAYRQDFGDAGFSDVSVEDISKDVFPGLEAFIHRHLSEMSKFGIYGNWSGYRIFGWILNWWNRTGVVRFVVVKGRRYIA